MCFAICSDCDISTKCRRLCSWQVTQVVANIPPNAMVSRKSRFTAHIARRSSSLSVPLKFQAFSPDTRSSMICCLSSFGRDSKFGAIVDGSLLFRERWSMINRREIKLYQGDVLVSFLRMRWYGVTCRLEGRSHKGIWKLVCSGFIFMLLEPGKCCLDGLGALTGNDCLSLVRLIE